MVAAVFDPAEAAIRERYLDYEHDGTALEAFVDREETVEDLGLKRTNRQAVLGRHGPVLR